MKLSLGSVGISLLLKRLVQRLEQAFREAVCPLLSRRPQTFRPVVFVYEPPKETVTFST